MAEQTRVQSITLTLSDGRQIVAMMPEFWDTTTPLGVVGFAVSEPIDLPPGCRLATFAELNDTQESSDESAR